MEFHDFAPKKACAPLTLSKKYDKTQCKSTGCTGYAQALHTLSSLPDTLRLGNRIRSVLHRIRSRYPRIRSGVAPDTLTELPDKL